MICKVCGAEYEGAVCPKCQTPAAVDYTKFDYFPNRSQLRQMQFPQGAQPFVQDVAEPMTGNTYPQPPAPETQGYAQDVPAPYREQPEQQTGPYAQWNPEDRRPYGICPKCGNVLRGDYCGQCGYFVGRSQQAGWQGAGQWNASQPQGWVGAPQQPPQPKTKTWVIVLVILLAILIPVGLLVGYFVFLFGLTNTIIDAADSYGSGSDSAYYEQYDQYESFDDFLNRYSQEDGSQQDIPEDEGESLYPNGVSNAEFAQLKEGMDYAEISAIIGGDGQVVAQEGASFTAVWIGEYRPSAIISIDFEEGIATSIEQEGLF